MEDDRKNDAGMTGAVPPPVGCAPVGENDPSHLEATGDVASITGEQKQPALAAGAHVGRYIILEPLGAGGMGVVYTAYDPKLHRKIALKLLHAAKGGTTGSKGGTSGQERLMREAQALAQLSHPNVVSVYDVGPFEDRVFLAMERVEGKSLRDRLNESRLPWREAVTLFKAAGEGLVAAHSVRLVHRDFKPDNLLLGNNGRVYVTDFGLARVREQGDDEEVTDPQGHITEGNLLDSELTQAGVVMGTTSYMAPELFHGSAADERSDQFAFFVSLFESLFGATPFPRGPREIRWKLKEPPKGDVPSWLRRIVLKGLSLSPDERFPSMQLALRELGNDPSVRRRQVAMVAAGLAVVAGFGVFMQRRANVDPCAHAAERMAVAWTPARSAQLREAFIATQSPVAASIWDTTSQVLSEYAQGWSQMSVDACAAARVRGEQSDADFSLRAGCLTRRLTDFTSLLEELKAPSPALVLSASKAARELPRLAGCADLDALRAPMPLPEDPKKRAQVEEVQAELSRGRAMLVAGKFAEAQSLAEKLNVRARELGYRPVEAEAAELSAGHLEKSLKLKEALVQYERAMWLALGSGHREVAARSAAMAVGCAGMSGLSAEATQWYERGSLLLEPLRRPPDIAAQLENAAGTAAVSADKPHEAEQHFKNAAELFRKAYGEKDPRLGTAGVNLGVVLFSQWKVSEALERMDQARQVMEASLGKDHPNVWTTLHNRAGIFLEVGLYAEGEPIARQVVTERIRILGEAHPRTASSLGLVGQAALFRGDYAEALSFLERAQPGAKTLGDGSTDTVTLRLELAQAHAELGDLSRALREVTEQLAASSKVLGEKNSSVIGIRVRLAQLLLRAGKVAEAKATVAEIEALTGKEEPGPRLRSGLLSLKGELSLRDRRFADAARELEGVLQIWKDKLPPDSAGRIVPLFGMARAYAAQGEAGRATAALVQALQLADKQEMAPRDRAGAELLLASLTAQPELAAKARTHFASAAAREEYETWLQRELPKRGVSPSARAEP